MLQVSKIFVGFIFMACLSVPASAEEMDSLFITANAAYAENDFEGAIRDYEAIRKAGLEAPELYFNLGNAYYKTRAYPKAILNYERALQLDPLNENIHFNLEKARMYNIDQVDIIPEFILKRGIKGLLELLQSNSWAITSLISFLLGLSFLLLYFLSLKLWIKRTGFYSAIFMLLLSVSTFFMAQASKNMIRNDKSAIVMSPTVTVKGSPSFSSTDLFIIHEGTKVYILDRLNEWYEIKLSDGKQGWLQQAEVEPV